MMHDDYSFTKIWNVKYSSRKEQVIKPVSFFNYNGFTVSNQSPFFDLQMFYRAESVS